MVKENDKAVAKGHHVKSYKQSGDKIIFFVEGDIGKSIREIYSNEPIVTLDVMRPVKPTRSMIFNLRSGGGK
jgi:hypothetical protein